ncbi:hypothetical protein B0H14DRAFT_3540814 [Mycena olivaceomarginata]|nr:hypothetical protein B0H14DRAFT_3540814 [Mycena olivaceomarginata]
MHPSLSTLHACSSFAKGAAEQTPMNCPASQHNMPSQTVLNSVTVVHTPHCLHASCAFLIIVDTRDTNLSKGDFEVTPPVIPTKAQKHEQLSAPAPPARLPTATPLLVPVTALAPASAPATLALCSRALPASPLFAHPTALSCLRLHVLHLHPHHTGNGTPAGSAPCHSMHTPATPPPPCPCTCPHPPPHAHTAAWSCSHPTHCPDCLQPPSPHSVPSVPASAPSPVGSEYPAGPILQGGGISL